MPRLVLDGEALANRYAVYIAWIGESCVYVGMTRQGFRRVFTNATLRKRWHELTRVEVEWQANSDQALAREAQLISELLPALNKSGRHAAKQADSRARVQRAIEQAHGDKQLAAHSLGISRATLYRRIAEHS
jgi:transcriptional regulator of acetoin/glycerol metabolism